MLCRYYVGTYARSYLCQENTKPDADTCSFCPLATTRATEQIRYFLCPVSGHTHGIVFCHLFWLMLPKIFPPLSFACSIASLHMQENWGYWQLRVCRPRGWRSLRQLLVCFLLLFFLWFKIHGNYSVRCLRLRLQVPSQEEQLRRLALVSRVSVTSCGLLFVRYCNAFYLCLGMFGPWIRLRYW